MDFRIIKLHWLNVESILAEEGFASIMVCFGFNGGQVKQFLNACGPSWNISKDSRKMRFTSNLRAMSIKISPCEEENVLDYFG